jgi:hypothetical protein
MCYGKPVELLQKLLAAHPPVPNDRGHTVLDDFDHLCAYSGLNEADAGSDAFAWAKYSYVSGRLTSQ